MTVQEAHNEYNSIIDQIWAKYQLLDSGECGGVDTPAESCELAQLLASETSSAKGASQAPALQALKELFRSKLQYCGRFRVRMWRMQFVPLDL